MVATNRALLVVEFNDGRRGRNEPPLSSTSRAELCRAGRKSPHNWQAVCFVADRADNRWPLLGLATQPLLRSPINGSPVRIDLNQGGYTPAQR